MLGDCHIHMALDAGPWRLAVARHERGADEAFVRKTLEAYKQRGVTFLRDGGDRWGAGLLAAKLAPEYGIVYLAPAYPLYKNGHYGSFIGRGFGNFEEYRALVKATRVLGGSFVKIMISGLMDFNRYGRLTSQPLEAEEIKDLIAFAHDEGFAVMAHANGDETVAAAIEAGVDSVEHGAYLREETLCRLAESRAVWVPTLSTIGNLLGDGRYPDEVVRPLFETQTELVRFAAAKGAKIAAGSDAGAYRVPHGRGAADERAYLEKAIGDGADKILDEGLAEIRKRFT
jgi:hypothetical protein